MRNILFGLLILLMAALPAMAQAPGGVQGPQDQNTNGSATITIEDSVTGLGYQQLTSLATAKTFTPPANATACYITAETAALRYRTDGTAPTATVGMPIAVGAVPVKFRLGSATGLGAIQLIQQSTGGVADIDCYSDN